MHIEQKSSCVVQSNENSYDDHHDRKELIKFGHIGNNSINVGQIPWNFGNKQGTTSYCLPYRLKFPIEWKGL